MNNPKAPRPRKSQAAEKSSSSTGSRRKLHFWKEFNDWWRSELELKGRRADGREISAWYARRAEQVWPADIRPTVEETRTHAKCMRSLTTVREYFRAYRSQKRKCADGDDSEDEQEMEDEEEFTRPTIIKAEPSWSTGLAPDKDSPVSEYLQLPLATQSMPAYGAALPRGAGSYYSNAQQQPPGSRSGSVKKTSSKRHATDSDMPEVPRSSLPPPISALLFSRIKQEAPAPPPPCPPPPQPPAALTATKSCISLSTQSLPSVFGSSTDAARFMPGLPGLPPIKTIAREHPESLAGRRSVSMTSPREGAPKPGPALVPAMARTPVLRTRNHADSEEEIEELMCELSQATPLMPHRGWAAQFTGSGGWLTQHPTSSPRPAATGIQGPGAEGTGDKEKLAGGGVGVPRMAHSVPAGTEPGNYSTWQPRRTASIGEVCSPAPKGQQGATLSKSNSGDCLSSGYTPRLGLESSGGAGTGTGAMTVHYQQQRPMFLPQQQQQLPRPTYGQPLLFFQPQQPAPQQQEYVLRNNVVVALPPRQPTPPMQQQSNEQTRVPGGSGLYEPWVPAALGVKGLASSRSVDLGQALGSWAFMDHKPWALERGSLDDLACARPPLHAQPRLPLLPLQLQQQHTLPLFKPLQPQPATLWSALQPRAWGTEQPPVAAGMPQPSSTAPGAVQYQFLSSGANHDFSPMSPPGGLETVFGLTFTSTPLQ